MLLGFPPRAGRGAKLDDPTASFPGILVPKVLGVLTLEELLGFRASERRMGWKVNGSVNRALGLAPGPFVSSRGTPAVISGATAAGVAATAGASDAELSVMLDKFGAENAALPCPGKTAGVIT